MSTFKEMTIRERRAWLEEAGLSEVDARLLDVGGLSGEQPDRLIENVIGTFALPLGVGLNLLVNGRDVPVPMAIEEASVVAAQSHAARIVRDGGGFVSEAAAPVMIAQVQLLGVDDVEAARGRLQAAEEALGRAARALLPRLHARGGGWRGLELRHVEHPDDGERFVVAHLLLDVRDAMGANLCNTLAEGLADRVAELAGGRAGLRILSNLADRRLVRTRCCIPARLLAWKGFSAGDVAEGVLASSRFAEADPYRAATHNKGILNGIDALLVATGNDWRAVEAGAHAYAARSGSYRPLSRFRVRDDGALMGELEMPMPVGIVGGGTVAHPLARRLVELMGVRSARELAEVCGAVGLGQNLAALKALATEGIQRGHMALHRRRNGENG